MISLETLARADYLSWLDTHFASGLARMAGEERTEVVLAIALASRAVRAGHVCLDLRRWPSEPAIRDASGVPLADQAWPEPAGWIDALRTSVIVGDGSGDTPLVLDAEERLYLRRYWEHERALAKAIQS